MTTNPPEPPVMGPDGVPLCGDCGCSGEEHGGWDHGCLTCLHCAGYFASRGPVWDAWRCRMPHASDDLISRLAAPSAPEETPT